MHFEVGGQLEWLKRNVRAILPEVPFLASETLSIISERPLETTKLLLIVAFLTPMTPFGAPKTALSPILRTRVYYGLIISVIIFFIFYYLLE